MSMNKGKFILRTPEGDYSLDATNIFGIMEVITRISGKGLGTGRAVRKKEDQLREYA